MLSGRMPPSREISFRGGHGFDGTEALFPPFDVCGIANVADGQGANGPYSIDLEAVSSAQPSYVFIESGNLPLVKEDYASNPAYFDALYAVKEGKTYSLISYRFYSTNVELALANCYQVGSVAYPDTFSDVDPEKKLDEIGRDGVTRSASSCSERPCRPSSRRRKGRASSRSTSRNHREACIQAVAGIIKIQATARIIKNM